MVYRPGFCVASRVLGAQRGSPGTESPVRTEQQRQADASTLPRGGMLRARILRYESVCVTPPTRGGAVTFLKMHGEKLSSFPKDAELSAPKNC